MLNMPMLLMNIRVLTHNCVHTLFESFEIFNNDSDNCLSTMFSSFTAPSSFHTPGKIY